MGGTAEPRAQALGLEFLHFDAAIRRRPRAQALDSERVNLISPVRATQPVVVT